MNQETRAQNDESDRLRKHPDERFDRTQQLIDLGAAAAELAAEAAASPGRHRQKTLSRFGNTTVALFHFTAGSNMPQHVARGTTSIHILEGRMTIHAAGQPHVLSAGQILVLAPNVPHDLHAAEESRMLLTINLQPTER